MSGMLNKLEGMMGMGNNNNNTNNNTNNTNSNMDPNHNNTANTANTNNNNNLNNNLNSNDRYEPAIQSGETYVKTHYSNNANIMRGEQFVEQADAYRLGRNAQGNMQGGVGGMMSSDPNVSAANPQAGNVAYAKQDGTDTTFNKEQANYGANGGLGPSPVFGGVQSGVNNQAV